MIEIVLLKYLESKLAVDVLTEQSNDKDEFVTIEKIGGGRTNFLFTSTFAIQSYSTSKLNAARLNELVIQMMDGLIELNEISKVKLNNYYDFTDTETKRYRYQAIFEITHY